MKEVVINRDPRKYYTSNGKIEISFGRHRTMFGDKLFTEICNLLCDSFGDSKKFYCVFTKP